MNFGRAVFVAVVLAILVTLHFTLRPLLDWRAGIDFLVIGALLVAVRVRPGTAAVLGLLLGAAVDAMQPDTFGAGALAMTLTAFTASRLKAAFFSDDIAINAIFVFLGKVLYDVIALVAERRVGGLNLLWQLVAWTPLSALATAAVGVVVLSALRPVVDRRRAR